MSQLPRDPFAGEPAPGSGFSDLADRQPRTDPRLGDDTPAGGRPSLWVSPVVAVGLVAAALWGLPLLVAR